MYNYLYSRPLWLIIVLIVIGISLWAYLAARRPKHWKEWNAEAFLAALYVIFLITLLSRSGTSRDVYLMPLHVLKAAKQQPELYREMLMNVFLFVPLGLTLPNALPDRRKRTSRGLMAVLAALILSVVIEWLQYRYALGTTETDDVLCNTLGALLGASHLLWANILKHRRNT